MACEHHISITNHARKRMKERGITRRQVDAVLRHGRRRRRVDDVRVQVHQRQVEQNVDRHLYDLIGVIVVLSRDERRVVTVMTGRKPTRSFAELRHLNEAGPTFKLGDLIEPQLREQRGEEGELRL